MDPGICWATSAEPESHNRLSTTETWQRKGFSNTMFTHREKKGNRQNTGFKTSQQSEDCFISAKYSKKYLLTVIASISTLSLTLVHFVLGLLIPFFLIIQLLSVSLPHTHTHTHTHTPETKQWRPWGREGEKLAYNPGHALMVTLYTQGHLICSQHLCLRPHSTSTVSFTRRDIVKTFVPSNLRVSGKTWLQPKTLHGSSGWMITLLFVEK